MFYLLVSSLGLDFPRVSSVGATQGTLSIGFSLGSRNRMIVSRDRPRYQITHKPTGAIVSVGPGYRNSMGAQRSMALRIVRSLVAAGEKSLSYDAMPLKPDRKYDMTEGLCRVLDLRTGFDSKDVASIMDGDIDAMLAAGIRVRKT